MCGILILMFALKKKVDVIFISVNKRDIIYIVHNTVVINIHIYASLCKFSNFFDFSNEYPLISTKTHY